MENQINNWVLAAKTYDKCPHCDRGILNTRVKRSFLVKNVFVWMEVKRYQCNVCAKKVYVKKAIHKQLSLQNN
jgi:hypothetical protein